MGSIRHEQIPMESAFSNREGFSLKLSIFYCSEYLISSVCVCVFLFTSEFFSFLLRMLILAGF